MISSHHPSLGTPILYPSRGTGVALMMKAMVSPSRDLRRKENTEWSLSWKSIHSKLS